MYICYCSLCKRTKIYDLLERYNCLPCENYLQYLKRQICSKKLPLHKKCNRIVKEESIDVKIKSSATPTYLSKLLFYPNPNITDIILNVEN